MYSKVCGSNLGASAHRTQQLGGVSHCGSTVAERRGELGRLAEVVFRVLWWLVDNTCKHVEQQRKKKQRVLMVKQLQSWITQGAVNTSMTQTPAGVFEGYYADCRVLPDGRRKETIWKLSQTKRTEYLSKWLSLPLLQVFSLLAYFGASPRSNTKLPGGANTHFIAGTDT